MNSLLNQPTQKRYLNYKIGKEYPLGFSVLGGMLAFVSEVLMYEKIISLPLGIPILLVGLALLLAHTGTLLDPVDRQIKTYTWMLGLKLGRWYSLEDYKDIVILRKKRKFGFNLRGGGTTIHETSYLDYEIAFANSTHYDRWLICRRNNLEKAQEVAMALAEVMQAEFVQYNPGQRRPRKKFIFDKESAEVLSIVS